MSDESRRESHNKGQTDASNGTYDRPHGHTEEFFAYGDTLKEIHGDNQAYDAGQQNTNSQKK